MRKKYNFENMQKPNSWHENSIRFDYIENAKYYVILTKITRIYLILLLYYSLGLPNQYK